MNAVTPSVVDDLRTVLGADRVRTGSTELGLYRRDASNIEGSAGVVCFPETTHEVREVVRLFQWLLPELVVNVAFLRAQLSA